MNEISKLLEIDIVAWFFTGFIILSCVLTLIGIIDKFSSYIGKPIKWFHKQSEEHDLLIKLIDDFDKFKIEQNAKNEAVTKAQMESMCDRIEQKCKYYIEINGIPSDEYDSFVRLYKAYRGINGNHGAEAKFNYCINNLRILPGKTF